MAERIIVRQNSQFITEFLAPSPENLESADVQPVMHIHGLTPYGMMLAGLGSCTAIVLHTYAQHHKIDLQSVEIRLAYDRIFSEDCENCETIQKYEEQITEGILLEGHLTKDQKDKLLKIAHQCPIQKILESTTEVKSELLEAEEQK